MMAACEGQLVLVCQIEGAEAARRKIAYASRLRNGKGLFGQEFDEVIGLALKQHLSPKPSNP